MGLRMSHEDRLKQIKEELLRLQVELRELQTEDIAVKEERKQISDDDIVAMFKYLMEERQKTNSMLEDLTSKIKQMQQAEAEQLKSMNGNDAQAPRQQGEFRQISEIAISEIDSKIINFVQTNDMVSADDVKEFMGYRGTNAACTRLNRLHKAGLLERFQLGHKVYYRLDAGKATNTMIISPPQRV